MNRRLRRWTIGLLVPFGLLAGLYLARGAILPAAARWLDVGICPQPADFVMVLGGGIDNRPFAAAAMVKAGLAHRVLVSHVKSGPANLAGGVPADDVIVRRVLVARGVSNDAITAIGHENASTYDEARSLRVFLDATPDVRVLILTSDFHTRRARWIFCEILERHRSQIAMVSTPSEDFRFDQWWRSEEGFLTIAGENLKFLLYVIYYGRSFRVAALIALLVASAAVYYHRRSTRPRRIEVCA